MSLLRLVLAATVLVASPVAAKDPADALVA